MPRFDVNCQNYFEIPFTFVSKNNEYWLMCYQLAYIILSISFTYIIIRWLAILRQTFIIVIIDLHLDETRHVFGRVLETFIRVNRVLIRRYMYISFLEKYNKTLKISIYAWHRRIVGTYIILLWLLITPVSPNRKIMKKRKMPWIMSV